MAAVARLDLKVRRGQPYLLTFRWKSAGSPPVALPLTGYVTVVNVWSGLELVGTTSGSDPQITLSQEPGNETGRVDLTFPAEFSLQMLRPYTPRAVMRWTMDLLNQDLSETVLELITGSFEVTDP